MWFEQDGYSLASQSSKPTSNHCLVVSLQGATDWNTCGWSQVLSVSGVELWRADQLSGSSFYQGHNFAFRGTVFILSLEVQKVKKKNFFFHNFLCRMFLITTEQVGVVYQQLHEKVLSTFVTLLVMQRMVGLEVFDIQFPTEEQLSGSILWQQWTGCEGNGNECELNLDQPWVESVGMLQGI